MNLRKELEGIGIPVPEEFPIDEWAARITDAPTRNLLALLAAATCVFYYSERRRNPKVNDIWDALIYTSTSISVGYGDIFARTPVGKLIGAALMTLGPSMASKALEGSPPAQRKNDAVQQEILATLKKILVRLEAQGA